MDALSRFALPAELVVQGRNTVADGVLRLTREGLTVSEARALVLAKYDQDLAELDRRNPRLAEIVAGPVAEMLNQAFTMAAKIIELVEALEADRDAPDDW